MASSTTSSDRLLDWKEHEVFAFIRRHGLEPNPLYAMGASRVQCWPFIFSRKNELRNIATPRPAEAGNNRRLGSECIAGHAEQSVDFHSLSPRIQDTRTISPFNPRDQAEDGMVLDRALRESVRISP